MDIIEPLIDDIKDEDLITMLFASELSETQAIKYLINRNVAIVKKIILKYDGTTMDVHTVMNDATIILINNVKSGKFNHQSTICTYFVGICKILWKNQLKKRSALKYNYESIEVIDLKESADVSSSINRFEKLNENRIRLGYVFSLITDKCKSVLTLWSQGLSMTEIKDRLGYKNAQIAMNKKNTCLKRVIEKIKKNDSNRRKAF